MGREIAQKNAAFRLYGRQKTRALNDQQQELIEHLLPNIDVSVAELSKKENPVLEIGFGFGEHLAHMAEKNPDTFYVGFEPFTNGVASILQLIDDKELRNINIHQGDVRHFLSEMPEQLFSAVYLLYPDPWPKKRHFKRRFIQKNTLAAIHRLLIPQGIFYIASDHDTYQTWIEEHIEDQSDAKIFEWTNKETKHTPWNGWIPTRYEEKAFREGRTPRYYVLMKK